MKDVKIAASILSGAICLGAFSATYKNPILTMDFSDPDICVGRDGRIYMTASSFGGLPGLPVLVSDDLVNWQYAGYALEKHPFETSAPEHGNCVWAPSIRYRADKDEYVIYWGDPDRGVYRVSAKDPAGPWSEPRLVVPGKGIIDPCPLYDDDGRIYLVNGWAQSRAGMNSVLTVRELDAEETRAISAPAMAYDGVPSGNFTCEGPKFYKRNGEYWLLFPAGGVSTGWQVAARAKTPCGPYEAKTVMAQGGSPINGPHQGGWVRTNAGEDWFVHFTDRDAYGRIVCLEPMEWREDGWPVIGADEDGDGCGEPVEEYAMPKGGKLDGQEIYPQTSDEFDDCKIGMQWQWLGKSMDLAGWATPYGFYRQYTTKCYGYPSLVSHALADIQDPINLWNSPNFMVQKFPAFAFSATMKAQVGAKQATAESGLIVQGRSYARIGLKYMDDGVFGVVYSECQDADKGKFESEPVVLATVPAKVVGAGIRTANVRDVWFKVEVAPGEVPESGLAPVAMCAFSWSLDGETWQKCPKEFRAREGKWIGATLGIYSISARWCTDRGWIDVDWFRVERK